MRNHHISTCLLYSYYPNGTMPKGKRVYMLLKMVLLRVYDYLDALEQRGGGRGALRRISESPGERTPYCWFKVRMFSASLQHRRNF